MRFARMESVRLAFKFGAWKPTRQVSYLNCKLLAASLD